MRHNVVVSSKHLHQLQFIHQDIKFRLQLDGCKDHTVLVTERWED